MSRARSSAHRAWAHGSEHAPRSRSQAERSQQRPGPLAGAGSAWVVGRVQLHYEGPLPCGHAPHCGLQSREGRHLLSMEGAWLSPVCSEPLGALPSS